MGDPVAPLGAEAWVFACPDWQDRLKGGRSLVPDLPLDLAEGNRAVGIFDKLRLPDVPGQPTMAEGAGDWQRDLVRAAFGSIDETGRRRVGEIFGLVPKKNSKTTGGAGIALTALLMNDRPRAELLLVGPTQEIADTAFQQIVGMVEADQVLAQKLYVQDHAKTITHRVTKAKLKVKTFDMKVMTGSKPVFVLLDELHIMAQYSYAARVIRQIRGGFMANPESLLVIITTQSDTAPAGVFKAELKRARAIRDGRIVGSNMLPVLYEFPEQIQADAKAWKDPKIWPWVLPNLGRSITIDKLLEDYRTAADLSDQDVQIWASQHLNVEIGLGLQDERWRGADHWLKAADPSLTLDELMARSEVCVVGIDGGGLDDLFGLSVIGRDLETRDWLIWAKAWAHKSVLERRPEIVERLLDFVEDGDLVICETATQDVVEACDIVERLNEAGLLPEQNAVGLDPVGVAAVVDELAVRNITDAQIAGIAQGYKLAGAVWGLERKLADGTVKHDGSGLMAWCVGNAKAEQRGNAVLITKQAAGKAKIDPLCAAFNAFTLMSRNPEGMGGDLGDFLKNAVVVK